MLEHLAQRLPQQFQIVGAKPGLLGQEGGHKAMRHIDAVGDGVFAAHGAVVAVLIFGLFFFGYSHTGDGVLQRHDGLHRARKGQLHRAAYLAAVHARGHHCTKGAHVKKVLAHPLARQRYLIRAALALFFGGFFLFAIICY